MGHIDRAVNASAQMRLVPVGQAYVMEWNSLGRDTRLRLHAGDSNHDWVISQRNAVVSGRGRGDAVQTSPELPRCNAARNGSQLHKLRSLRGATASADAQRGRGTWPDLSGRVGGRLYLQFVHQGCASRYSATDSISSTRRFCTTPCMTAIFRILLLNDPSCFNTYWACCPAIRGKSARP